MKRAIPLMILALLSAGLLFSCTSADSVADGDLLGDGDAADGDGDLPAEEEVDNLPDGDGSEPPDGDDEVLPEEETEVETPPDGDGEILPEEDPEIETPPDGDETEAADGDGEILPEEEPESDTPPDGDDAEIEEESEPPTLDLQAISGLTANLNFDHSLTVSGAIFEAPYPCDYYKDEDGTIALPGFPVPSSLSMTAKVVINMYKSNASSRLHGFGTNGPITVSFSEAIQKAALPTDAASTLNPATSPLLLLNVDPDSSFYGELLPVEWAYTDAATQYEPANLLAVGPVDGFPMLPDTTYALILTDGVLRASDSTPLGRTQSFSDLISGRSVGNTKLESAFRPLVDWLIEQSQLRAFDPNRVRAATVFTTQETYGELKSMQETISEEYPDGAYAGDMVAAQCSFYKTTTGGLCFKGRYTAHNFMKGNKPYALSGSGYFEFNGDGDPVSQGVETLDFAACIPDGTMPEGGWPVVIVQPGTCGLYDSYIGDGDLKVSTRLLNQDVATIGIDLPLHGSRGSNYTCDNLETYSFNIANPDSARTINRQAALDVTQLVRLIQTGSIRLDKTDCTTWPTSGQYSGPDLITFDPAKILFHGHSQGGLAGALAVSVERSIHSWLLSGAGGRIQITIMERTDPNVLDALVEQGIIIKSEAHKYHPLFGLVQMLVDVADPINYAAYWFQHSFDGEPRNVMVTSGFLDQATPKLSAFAMAIAGYLPIIEPVGEAIPLLETRGVSPASFARPASLNIRQGTGTAGFCQYPSDNHYAIYNNTDAASMYAHFLGTAADGAPQLGGF